MARPLKLLVTGREGQVARALGERGNESVRVAFLARPELDLADVKGVADVARRAIGRERPDVLVSAAAFTAVDAAEDDEATARAVNAEAPGELARAAHEAGVPIIHLSTDYVFDGTLDRPYREDDPTGPQGVYGETKLEGERLVTSATLAHVVLRTAWLYSMFGRNFVTTMLRLADTRDEVSVVADQHGSPTSAHDLAGVIIEIGHRIVDVDPESAPERFGTFHAAGAGAATWAELARHAIETHAGDRKVQVRDITSAQYPTRAHRPGNSRLDCTKLSRCHGIELRPWQEALNALSFERRAVRA